MNHGPNFVTNVKYDAIIVSIATGDFIKIHESINGSTPTRDTSYIFQIVLEIVVVFDMMIDFIWLKIDKRLKKIISTITS